MVTPYNTRGSALLQPPDQERQAKANQTMPGRNALAAAGRAVQQGPANYAGMATKAGFKPPPRPGPVPPTLQPRQGQERAFRAVMQGSGNAYGPAQKPPPAFNAVTQAAPPNFTSASAAGSQLPLNNVKNTTMGAGGFGGSMRQDINIPVPQAEGGAGSVQTRRDAYIAGGDGGGTQTDPNALAQNSTNDRRAWGAEGYYGSTDRPEARYGWWEDGSGLDIGRDGVQLYGDNAGPVTGDTNSTGNIPGFNGGGGGGGDSADSWLEKIIRLSLGGLKNSVFDPSVDFADQLNNSAKDKIPAYYNNWEDLKDLRNSGKELLGNEYYDSYDKAAREQLQADVAGNRDAMMRQALSQSYGGGRGMGGNMAGQVADSSARALAEGNRGIAMDSMQRRLQGKQIGGAQEQAAVGMIYDLMNQGYTDPREIFSAILEMAPEMAGALAGVLDSILPG